MKTAKLLILFGIISIILLSCDNPVAMGNRLDLDGPIVDFISPVARKAVSTQFAIEGTASDYTGIEQLLLKTESNGVQYPKQWRFYKGSWEVSQNHGANWQPLSGAEWNGTMQDASWKIPIDMDVDGTATEDGEYMFILQAWDKGRLSDENSYKTRVLIIDRNPPKVDISNPYLYRGSAANLWEISPLKEIHDILDSGNERFDPAMIGKFLTQSFQMQWQIEDNEDVWSIDIRFYNYDEDIDDDPHTALPDNYIYRYHQNLPPPPDIFDPNDIVKPNGSIIVPALTSVEGNYDGAELNNPISEKTTVKVVAACYDAAGNPNQEKTLGYFVYWPLADEPWIAFADGMEEPEYYDGMDKAELDEELFMIYPGRKVKASAYHAHGLKEVVYSLYKYDEVTWTIDSDPIDIYDNKKIENVQRPNGSYSTIFTWEFTPPSLSGYYVIKAKSYSLFDKESAEYSALFRVQDITFPNFPAEPAPPSGEPLFKHITDNTITINGEVSDATEIAYLCMVWINPKSRNYAAMSQLQYFRDPDYAGWEDAKKLLLPPEGSIPGSSTSTIEIADPVSYPGVNYPYDASNPNRLWRIPVTHKGLDPDTGRQLYEYSVTVNLTDDLGIAMDEQPLVSQVFQLRAENPDGKCTIITYAPQGDTLAPVLNITNVKITGGGGKNINCIPNQYTLIPQFAANDEITINGTWSEDSTGYLPIQSYLTPNFDITVNGYSLPVGTLSFTPASGTAVSGSWTATAVVDASISASYLKDTLVISANIRDIGGNYTEAGCSWLIESDHLRLMRVSSENPDQTYKTGDTVEIFLEFNKPVQLTNSGTPKLLLNSTNAGATAVAEYKAGQTNQSSRQYFVYTVGADHSTGAEPNCLNVTGLDTATAWNASGYPFTWHRGSGDEREEIRVTTDDTHNGEMIYGYYVRNLPVTDNPAEPDYQFTLFAGKHILIDTAPPVVTGIKSNTAAGHYSTGSEIYITVEFDKPVTIGSTPPRLELKVNNGASTSAYTNSSNVRVNGSEITFVYNAIAGDTTGGNPIEVNTYTGSITDLAGNILAASGISSFGSRTLTGRYIDTIKPDIPTVRLLSAGAPYNSANIVENNVNGSNVTGESAGSAVNLSNVYHEKLWLAVEGNTSAGAHKLSVLEYSINNGASWVKAGNITNTPFELLQQGSYNIIARQTDRAGNVSDETEPISFVWDSGNLVTRISSATPNGIYTHNAGRNQIEITVYFRKEVIFTSTPSLVLNAQRSGSDIIITANAGQTGAAKTSLVYTYDILQGDSISGNTNLDVTGFTGTFVARDGSTATTGVNVVAYMAMPEPVSSEARLGVNKDLKIDTSLLNVLTEPVLTGSVQADGSWAGTMTMTFNNIAGVALAKGTGSISIEQIAGTSDANRYRLPAVLTEAQYNKVRDVPYINTFYVRSTNGYIIGTGSDTSTKYVLAYTHDTAAITPNSGAAVDSIARFAHNMRLAESIEIPVNAQAVAISGNALTVMLTGSNALQVPGAMYTISFNAGFVQDSLGNQITARSYDKAIGGVAKPFVRIRKAQDSITTSTAANTPIYVAVQPQTTNARMDCRTPGSDIIYRYQYTVTNVTARNWGIDNDNPGDPHDSLTTGNPDPISLGDPASGTANTGRPLTTASNAYSTEITLPLNDDANAAIADYQGYQWLVRAVGRTGTTGNYSYSAYSEEIAYRTVLSYQLNAMGTDGTGAGQYGFNIGTGEQVWIRGGDAIGSSTVPGFPLTWADDWASLEGKRAGIRLLTKTSAAGTTLNNSTYKWVSWEINVPTYFDMIRGNSVINASNDAAVAWQYGPRGWSYQRAGWTSFKDQYLMFPGKHRWLYVNGNNSFASKGKVNFSGTWALRPTYTATSGWDTANNANPVPTPVTD